MSWMTARSKHNWKDRQGFIDDVRASTRGGAMSWMTARSKHNWKDRQGFIDDVRASLVGVAQCQDVSVTIWQVEGWMDSVIGKYCDNVEWMSDRTWNTARNEIWRYLEARPDVEVAQ